MKLWIIVGLVVLLVILVWIVYPKIFPRVHIYWDQQPVIRKFDSTNSTEFGTDLIITHPKKLPPPQINNKYQVYHFDINSKRESTELRDFWNQHFIKGYRYTLPFLHWSLPIETEGNLCIRDGMQIIGTISTRQYSIVMGDITRTVGYVDYLSIHKNYRNNRLAPLLISETVARYPGTNRMSFIFRIEEKPLPFLAIVKYRYYVYDLTGISQTRHLLDDSNNLHPLTESELTEAWKFYQHESRDYLFRIDLSLDEFRRWFLPIDGIVYTYIRRQRGTIISLVSGFKCEVVNESFIVNGDPVPVMEITMILSKRSVIHPTGTIVSDIRDFLKISKKIGTTYVVAPNTGPNNTFIKVLGFVPGKRCYLQLYNLSFTRSLQPEEVLFF